MADAKEMAQGAVERLLGDEGLRGNLNDAGYGPLVEWGVALVEKRVATAKGQPEVDAFGQKVREAIRAIVKAAEEGKVPEAAALTALKSPGIEQALQQLKSHKPGSDADQNAAAIAAVLKKATG